MDLVTAVKTCLNKYADFQGRACRSEYWYFILFITLLGLVVQIVDAAIGTGLPYLIVALGLLLPNTAALVRRLHDIGKSGWWWFIAFIPVVGAIVLLIWVCKRGDAGENRFGADPLL